MSSNAAPRGKEAGHHVLLKTEHCDDFFTWAEIEHRRNTMSVEEAATLLCVDVETANDMINEGTLCASIDDSTGEWLVKTACVRAQLADTVPLASGDDIYHNADETKIRRLNSAAKRIALIKELNAMADIVSTDHLKTAHAVPTINIGGTNQYEFDASVYPTDAGPNALVKHTADGSILETPGSSEDEPFSRETVTAKNVEALMDSLDFANVRLEGAMYRIGYLEAQVYSLEAQVALMNEYRNKASNAILIDRENDILKDTIKYLENKVSTLENSVVNLENNLSGANYILGRLEQTWWFRFFAWFFRFQMQ